MRDRERSHRRAKSGNSLEITSLSALEHLLEHRPERILSLRTASSNTDRAKRRLAEILEKAKALGIRIEAVKETGTSGITAQLAAFVYTDFKKFLSDKKKETSGILLALDHLQDPQNFGALCRTADAFDIQGILLPKDRTVTVGPGVYHASAGAVDTVPISLVNNLSESLRRCKEAGYWIVGTALSSNATTIDRTPSFEKIVLVMGTEHEGLSPLIKKNCDWILEIPLLGRVQSLNVSVAGGLFLYEWSKRLGRL